MFNPGPDERWKLEVNDRYQRAVATVITLSTASLVAPIVFLKDAVVLGEGKSIVSLLDSSVYVGGVLLGLSIVSGVLYYYFSAKWVKMALVKTADVFWFSTDEGFLEFALDATYFVMMVGFLAGAAFMLRFMATYVTPK